VKLLIISATAHYQRGGIIVGHGPTVTEINHLAELFEEVIHIGMWYGADAPPSALPYSSKRVAFIPVPFTGGPRLVDKLDILFHFPRYLRVMSRELSRADVVHVRCPANISMLAVILLAMVRNPRLRWVKYAGNWHPSRPEAWSYRFQRWWLRKGFHRGFVTVNGTWPNQPKHVRTFINPCITDEELSNSIAVAARKKLSCPIRLLFVGAVNDAKGVGRAIQVVRLLHQQGVSLTLDVIGDGPSRREYEEMVSQLGLGNCVQFHGVLSRAQLNKFYSQAHLMLFPTDGEGWPKILSEGIAYGVVPVSSNVGSIPYYLKRFNVGRALDPYDLKAFAQAIIAYYENPGLWKQESENGLRLAQQFTYNRYLQDVRDLLGVNA